MALLFVGCDPNAPATSSKVETGAASDITTKSVVLHGVVNVDISQYDDVEFGMMISEVKDDLNNRDGEMFEAKVLMGKKFKLDLKNLSPGTEYYYCAWLFLNDTQYEFGDIKKFTTLAAPGVNEITILTGSAEDLTYNSVVLYGELEANFFDYTSIKYGISYSPNKSDLQSDNGTLVYCSESLQDNKYSVALSSLEAETKYYYCAFAYVNDQDFKFGTVKNFTTLEAPKIDGGGVFSVSATKQVTFSPGNLQYHPANNVWQFAANQTDYIGDANANISSTYNGWIDLFGWSTSTMNFGVSTSTDYDDYYGSFVDWGTNKIGNDAPNTWRTLTSAEWNYLRRGRPNASSLRGVAQVNGVNGLIFLPDNWTCPAGVTFKSGFHSSNGTEYYTAYQTFTAEQWSKLEKSGAVLLPAAGYRDGSGVYGVQRRGHYWSASVNFSGDANCLDFLSGEANLSSYYRYGGQSVRLVKDIQ